MNLSLLRNLIELKVIEFTSSHTDVTPSTTHVLNSSDQAQDSGKNVLQGVTALDAEFMKAIYMALVMAIDHG
ncbi:hypothetical protein PanWU01x14_038540 [Parasponia andersonii]|uniref:Uncharacterized protein n=1 Tax=Parasponia andersonii TaxID=3476 RepID=A0A2P5DRI4_PARAD|nr:hypothetical protein PanWU01x14_038540 [Parasponia andersonii]